MVKKGTGKLERGVNSMEEDLGQLQNYFDDLQQLAENTDNNFRKNNIRLREAREVAENSDLRQFLEEIFMACLGADSETVIQTLSIFRVGGRIRSLNRPRCLSKIFL